jgi:hypothetical protein
LSHCIDRAQRSGARCGRAGGAGGPTPITSCGQTVMTSAVLTQDLSCTGAGVVVGAPGVKIDLKGFNDQRRQRRRRLRSRHGRLRQRHRRERRPPQLPDRRLGGRRAEGHRLERGHLRKYPRRHPRRRPLRARSARRPPRETATTLYVLANSVKVSSVTASENADYGVFVGGDFAQLKSANVSGNGNSGVFVDGDSARITSLTDNGNAGDGNLVTGNFAAAGSGSSSQARRSAPSVRTRPSETTARPSASRRRSAEPVVPSAGTV